MKAVGKQCAYPKCKQRIIGVSRPKPTDSEWMVKMTMHGYCMKHGILVFSNLVPVIRPDPNAEYSHWAMIDGELTPLVKKFDGIDWEDE